MWVLETEKKIVGGREGEGDTHTEAGMVSQRPGETGMKKKAGGVGRTSRATGGGGRNREMRMDRDIDPGDRSSREKPWKAKWRE